MPVGVGLPHRYPEQLATFFFGSRKLQRNMGTGVQPVQNSLFAPNFSKSGRHPRPGKWEICFFVLFGDYFFLAFFFLAFCLFRFFFALIRVTV